LPTCAALKNISSGDAKPLQGVVILQAKVTLKSQGIQTRVLHQDFVENTFVLEEIIARSHI
jgi:hypothetical protein